MNLSDQAAMFWQLPRERWAGLAPDVDNPLTLNDLMRLRSLGDPIDLSEVRDVYLPLSQLLHNIVANRQALDKRVKKFLRLADTLATPFVIGVAGSVAVGKSTVSRLLRELISRWSETLEVSLITTDGFLYPNRELERRGLMSRKGFPESYNRRALLEFLSQIKGGAENVTAPHYSHVKYDIVPGEKVTIKHPQVLIIEGLNVLQPPLGDVPDAVSDFLDFGIYVDAHTDNIHKWYVDRFLHLQRESFSNPESYFNKFSELDESATRAIADQLWDSINLPNLRKNIIHTRNRANLILHKTANHQVSEVLLRKL